MRHALFLILLDIPQGIVTNQSPPEYVVTTEPIKDIGQLGREWCALEAQSVNHSFFLSWHWIGSWLRSLPERIKPLVIRVRNGEATVGLAILVHGQTRVLKLIKLPQIALNASGEACLDKISIEYNGFLSVSGQETHVERAAIDWLLRTHTNESLLLPAIETGSKTVAGMLASATGRHVKQLAVLPAPYVDLAAIRNAGGDYLSHLSRNSRQSLRRSLRYYEAHGPLQYHRANSLEEAIDLFAQLEQAHQTYWRTRGQPGAFAEPFFRQFHAELIRSAFTDGHIEMAVIKAGAQIIGYLYNFIWRDRIYAYQSGFNYSEDRLAKPGYVSHYMAILSALKKGQNVYDFMAGRRQHKTSLSTAQQSLVWLQLLPPLLSVRLETCINFLTVGIRKR